MIDCNLKTKISAIPLEHFYLRNQEDGLILLREPKTKKAELDMQAICIFLATGMFLAQDTYFTDLKTAKPGEVLYTDGDHFVRKRESRNPWRRRTTQDVSLVSALEEFDTLLATSNGNRDIILPISGGLDSRTLAAASSQDWNVRSYSYAFDGGIDELAYGRLISRCCGMEHTEFLIPSGYLWSHIDRFPELTNCYAEFTHPRQVAVLDEVSELGDELYLGHWGDVLFDDFGFNESTDQNQLISYVNRTLCKSSGIELARHLWQSHGFSESFDVYLKGRIEGELAHIEAESSDHRMRIFKSLNWAPRWTSVNLSIFSRAGRLNVPYYRDEMVDFVSGLPEKWLKNRYFQIEYIKWKNRRLAEVPWQAMAPFNLNTYKNIYGILGLPVRAYAKAERVLRRTLRKEKVRQNWELQFLGKENRARLDEWLLENPSLTELVSRSCVEHFLERFDKQPQSTWHAVSMLLTLSVFAANQNMWVEKAMES